MECGEGLMRKWARRCVVEKSDYWHRLLLRARRERPCDRYATEKRDQLAPL
jgi:hypothetical protein